MKQDPNISRALGTGAKVERMKAGNVLLLLKYVTLISTYLNVSQL